MRFLIITCLLLCTYARAEPYTINVIETYKGHIRQSILENVFNELYAPLGITPRFVYYPSKRGLLLANQGTIDAEAGRYESTAKNYLNLIKVDESLAVFHSGFYCLSKEACKLAASAKIVALSSFQIAQTFCNAMKLKCHLESEPIAIALMLEKGVAHSFFSSTIESNKVLCAIKSENVYYYNMPELAQYIYHFVNKRHVLLVPELKKSMMQLKQKGLLPTSKLQDKPTHSSCGKQIISV
jgi:polar amino acid transport system substrate-binding protein